MSTTKVLTEDSTLKCSHTGDASVTPSTTKLVVNGSKVWVKQDVEGATGFSGCTNTPPPAGRVACTAVDPSPAVGGAATKLTVQGKAVMLDTVTGKTNSQPVKGDLTLVDAGQTKFTAT